MSEEILINGKKITELSDMFFEYCELKKETERLQKENEKLKKKNKELLNLSNNGGALLVAESTKNKKYKQALEEIREILMCKIYSLSENDSQLDYMCKALDKFEKIRIKILTKTNEVLNDRD